MLMNWTRVNIELWNDCCGLVFLGFVCIFGICNLKWNGAINELKMQHLQLWNEEKKIKN